MLKISDIDNNLSIYKENKVVILGEKQYITQVLNILIAKKIDIFAICCTNEFNTNDFNEVKSITFDELKNLNQNEILIQLAYLNYDVSLLKGFCYITFEEAMQVINFIDKLKLIKQMPMLLNKFEQDNLNLKKNQTIKIQQEILNSKNDSILLLCLPPKTGDHTLMETFDKFNINYHMLWHTPKMFDKVEFLKLNKPIKIITAVREPISRDISSLYQGIEFIFSSPMIDKLNLHLKSPHIMTNGGDAQQIFDLQFNNKDGATPIVDFMNGFKDNIINLLDYPFDKEAGYSIIKTDEIEVFIYQLEKINNIISPLNHWLDTSIDKFILGNSADDKWVSNSYNQAKKQLKINRDYLEKYYSSDWVKHFYSTDDITKFKEKWQKNIKD